MKGMLYSAHNNPSAERRLRPAEAGRSAGRQDSQPSFSRKAVATWRTHAWRICASHSQPSFSRKAVATQGRGRWRRWTCLTTILQPKGGCDVFVCLASLQFDSQPSFSRKAVATSKTPYFTRMDLLTTILQPKGGCDQELEELFGDGVAHNHPSAERRLRQGQSSAGESAPASQPSFSRKAVATIQRVFLIHQKDSQPSFSRKAVATSFIR